MKTLTLITLGALTAAAPLSARTLNLTQGNVTYIFNTDLVGRMPVNNAANPSTLEVNGFSFPLQNTSIMVDEREVEDNTVDVVYSGNTAQVYINGNIADYVSAEVLGGHVVITQSDQVSDTTCGEITYRLTGSSEDGSFAMTGSFKATIELKGVSLTSPNGAALNIQHGKRSELSAKWGTENNHTDGTGGDWKGAIVCKGHLEFKGKGTLNVTGNTAHAIYAKEYVEIKNLYLNVLKSVKDGINCSQYFLMESGNLNIAAAGDDGIQVDYKDDTNREAEDTGSATINGGTIGIRSNGIAAKGISCEGDMTITGGIVDATVTGNGKWDSTKSKTKASAGLSADGALNIEGGEISMHATGSGGKGISCDGILTINDGVVNIQTNGGVLAYVNNQINHNYTGSTDRLNSDYKSSPKGVKCDSNTIINGGTINVTCTGNGGEGIESKAEMTINGGNITAITTDDAINSSSTMTINGGNVTVISSGNDGIDSNGNLYIKGGYIRAFGAGSPECGIDVNSEQGYKLYFTGGQMMAVGGNNSTPSNSSSTQNYVQVSLSVSAGQTVQLKSGTNEIVSFEVPTQYKASSSSGGGGGRPGGGPGGSSGGAKVLITTPELVKGTSYTVTNGTSSVNGTATAYGSSSPWENIRKMQLKSVGCIVFSF